MSDLYTEVIDCARRIARAVGTCADTSQSLALSGRFLDLPVADLGSLLSSSTYERLPSSVRSRIEASLHDRVSSLQDHSRRRYRQMVEQQHSLEHCGLPDGEVEEKLAQAVEERYRRCIVDIRNMLAALLGRSLTAVDNRNTRGGFGDRTLRILETAFSYTKSPLSTEIDHLSKLTSLEPHQVRTWFQNKRNRGNKSSANAKKSLRTASASLVQSATQLPIIDGRRVASLPSRKYVPAPQVRATRPLPRRDVPIQDVPLARTLSQESQESDGTNFSFSSIPSNGGFTGFSYPSIQPPTQMVQQPTYNLDPLITATYSQPIYPPVQQIYDPLIPQQVDQYNLYGDVTNYPQPTQMSELDFESYLNLNIDNLAPPTEDLGYDLEAQIQAALRPSTTQTETLAPTMSPSETSPYSDFSNSWFNEFDFGNLEGGGDDMELLKVVLDGMSNGSMEGSPIEKTELYPGLGVGGRSESPETVASFALNSEFSSQGGSGSGRQSPNVAGPSTSNSVVNSENENDLSFMFNFDLAVSQDVQGDVDYGQNAVAGGSGSGSGWIGGVLPYDMGDQVMGTA